MQISFNGYLDVDRPSLKKLARKHKLAIRDGESADTYAVRLFNHILDGGVRDDTYGETLADVYLDQWDCDEHWGDPDDEYTGGAQW